MPSQTSASPWCWVLPAQVGSQANWAVVGGGTGHTCGVKVDGTRYCWGLNTFGQVGNGTYTNTHQPTLVS